MFFSRHVSSLSRIYLIGLALSFRKEFCSLIICFKSQIGFRAKLKSMNSFDRSMFQLNDFSGRIICYKFINETAFPSKDFVVLLRSISLQ